MLKKPKLLTGLLKKAF